MPRLVVRGVLTPIARVRLMVPTPRRLTQWSSARLELSRGRRLNLDDEKHASRQPQRDSWQLSPNEAADLNV